MGRKVRSLCLGHTHESAGDGQPEVREAVGGIVTETAATVEQPGAEPIIVATEVIEFRRVRRVVIRQGGAR